MNTYTQIQTQLAKPVSRQVMADYARAVVRKEILLLLADAPEAVIDSNEEILQETWYELRKWAYPMAELGFDSRNAIVNKLTGHIIETARTYAEFAEIPRAQKTLAIHRILSRKFPGLFTNPDPPPQG